VRSAGARPLREREAPASAGTRAEAERTQQRSASLFTRPEIAGDEPQRYATGPAGTAAPADGRYAL